MSVEALHHVWTLDEYLDLPEDDGFTYELFDGMLLVSARPVPRHQRIVYRLRDLLARRLPAGLEALPDIDVQIPAGVLAPDVCVCRTDKVDDLAAVTPAAAVLVAVEVESPSTRRRDRIVKPGGYAEAGIPHYWRVEWADGGPVLVVHQLAGEHYVEKQRLLPGSVGRVEQPFPVELDPAELV